MLLVDASKLHRIRLQLYQRVMGKGEESNRMAANESSFLTSPSMEASKMLEAALLQMDGIISGTTGKGICNESGIDSNLELKDPVKDATKNLVLAIKSVPQPPLPPDAGTTEILLQWMQPARLRKLENERTALHMEVSVLSEQVEAQSCKITELESMLQEKKDSLRRMEEALQKEVLSRSALETQKLELLSSLSEMKLKQASLERENLALGNGGGSPLSNGDRFGRHTGQYSSLPRPRTTSRKEVAFAQEEEEEEVEKPMSSSTPLGPSGRFYETSAPVATMKPLATLSIEEVGNWLARLGLECYFAEVKRWGGSGSKLLDSSPSQLEKELDIKNTLHRKKLQYAVESEKCNGEGFLGSDKMDGPAVLRWLDDIGLPQHKEAFHNAKIDGRVLHRLTTEDLLHLGVHAQLHAASLRRGIQVLRELNFEYDALERRPLNGDGADSSNVALWTNHRAMEWLRVVDLAEYAPNLRGSGVHGGLMVYEGRFTSELLATLLSIPPAKTLLRRHLTTHFNQILGREVVQHKREIESTLGFVPLTLTARLKVPKKSQFTLKRKKSKSEVDYGNLVCPLEASPPDVDDVAHAKLTGCIG
ncbi:liprin-beta-1 [Orussus abietinus]|uniref:liprin-beta-1 n=1 Tax=Orussus abietinus TaxID=222816 RepID=UPI000625CB03|nr:liprin-beta-1 [Orussus abietinus]